MHVHPTNGMYMISQGGRYAGLAGASTAMGGSVMDLHGSPALLGIDGGTSFEAGFRFNHAEFQFRDEFRDPNPRLYYRNNIKSHVDAPLPYVGLSTNPTKNIALGFAFYLVGGGGGEFQGITRVTPGAVTANELARYSLPYGGSEKHVKESVFARMAHARLSSGLSLSLGDLRLGAVAGIAHGRMEMRQLLHDPSDSLELPGTGLRYRSDPAFAFIGSLGISYDASSTFRFALSWSSPTVFNMDGEMRVNVGDPDFYYRNRVSMRMTWPEQYRLGMRARFNDTSLSIDIGFINWSHHMSTIRFDLDQPVLKTPLGTSMARLPMNLHTRDQTVFAIGIEHATEAQWVLRCGYNYARANLEPDGVNPLFAVTTEHHLAIGLGLPGKNWSWDFALEYAFPNRIKAGDASNWDLGHAVFGFGDFRQFQYEHSKSMWAMALIVGVTRKLDSN